jgi:SAM-dependent methyltransferase
MNLPTAASSLRRAPSRRSTYKPLLANFLAHNPFPFPRTLGFFYREKMRAIHTIAPDLPFRSILEVGGGQGGLTTLLYPRAQITNIDLVPEFAKAACNQKPNVEFVVGDAICLPFEDCSFDAVTMLDVLEHIPDDRTAIAEAFRVLRPGGYLLISTPDCSIWRFPYYSLLSPLCDPEALLMSQWGHARRGYTLADLEELLTIPCIRHATFINRITVVGHDLAFSRLPKLVRICLLWVLSPLVWIGYWCHHPTNPGTEIASCWQQP